MACVIIGSDKSGFALKEAVKVHLIGKGWTVQDVGTQSEDQPVPYFQVAPIVAQEIQSGRFERGILICGTGAGMAIVANMYKGVHAVACESTYTAEKARAINDANILCMGGWAVSEMIGCEMAEVFLNTGFTDHLEDWRKEFVTQGRLKVRALEKELYNN